MKLRALKPSATECQSSIRPCIVGSVPWGHASAHLKAPRCTLTGGVSQRTDRLGAVGGAAAACERHRQPDQQLNGGARRQWWWRRRRRRRRHCCRPGRERCHKVLATVQATCFYVSLLHREVSRCSGDSRLLYSLLPPFLLGHRSLDCVMTHPFQRSQQSATSCDIPYGWSALLDGWQRRSSWNRKALGIQSGVP